MMLGFMDRFVPMAEDGSKTHSIRSGERWKVGMRADLYARPRQKGMRLLFRAPVKRVEDITIWLRKPQARMYPDEPVFMGALGIAIGGEILTDDEANALAYRDGFRDSPLVPGGPLSALADMASFWLKTHDVEAEAFKGQLIHWDYARRFCKEGEVLP